MTCIHAKDLFRWLQQKCWRRRPFIVNSTRSIARHALANTVATKVSTHPTNNNTDILHKLIKLNKLINCTFEINISEYWKYCHVHLNFYGCNNLTKNVVASSKSSETKNKNNVKLNNSSKSHKIYFLVSLTMAFRVWNKILKTFHFLPIWALSLSIQMVILYRKRYIRL